MSAPAAIPGDWSGRRGQALGGVSAQERRRPAGAASNRSWRARLGRHSGFVQPLEKVIADNLAAFPRRGLGGELAAISTRLYQFREVAFHGRWTRVAAVSQPTWTAS